VALLCTVRLAALALAAVVLALGSEASPGEGLVLLAALPMSYLPLRRASRPGSVELHPALAAVDSVLTVAVLVVTGLDSIALGYVAASLVVAALWRGPWAVWGLFGCLVALHVAAVLGGATSGGPQVLAITARLLLFAAVGYAGVRLRDLLLSQERLDAQVREAGVRQAAAQERARLAREMHDSLSKTLHGTHLLATALHLRLCAEGSCAAPDVQGIAVAVDTARQDARRLLCELREEPVVDLLARLRELTTQWSASTGVPVELDLPAQEPPLAPAGREELARSVEELIENVARHARASRVRLSLRPVAGAVEVSVQDDGVGLGSVDLVALYRAGHYGLIGVRERMLRVSGSLALRQGERGGTEAVLCVPTGARAAVQPTRGVVPQRPATQAS
jgi:signal transduction histidine kinase